MSRKPYTHYSQLNVPDLVRNDAFGSAIALSADGKVALIGACRDDRGKGSAYIFMKIADEWVVDSKLTAAIRAPGDKFGSAVALSADGQVAVVSAVGYADKQGAVYVFRRKEGEWIEETKLCVNDTESFGNALALDNSGQLLLVGAPGTKQDQGAAFIFNNVNSHWLKQIKLMPIDGKIGDRFGAVVALSANGKTLFISAPKAKEQCGVVYVFKSLDCNLWHEQSILSSQAQKGNGNFGCSLAVTPDGDMVLVGACGEEGYKGVVYLFVCVGGWTIQHKLTVKNGESGDRFGSAIALSADNSLAVIGATHALNKRGAVYLYDLSSDDKILSNIGLLNIPESNTSFAKTVAIDLDGNDIFIGAAKASQHQGTVYRFPKHREHTIEDSEIDEAALLSTNISKIPQGVKLLLGEL